MYFRNVKPLGKSTNGRMWVVISIAKAWKESLTVRHEPFRGIPGEARSTGLSQIHPPLILIPQTSRRYFCQPYEEHGSPCTTYYTEMVKRCTKAEENFRIYSGEPPFVHPRERSSWLLCGLEQWILSQGTTGAAPKDNLDILDWANAENKWKA